MRDPHALSARVLARGTKRSHQRCDRDAVRRGAPLSTVEAFAANANAHADIYDRDFEEFWDSAARERVSWFEPHEKLLHWELPYAEWFLGGKLNVAYNCVDRHVEAGLGDRVAYHWEGEPGDTRTITYADLQREVVRFASALRGLGVGKGTRVAIYMGMIPELAVAMLACTRLGAPHTVVFGDSRPTLSPTGSTTWVARCSSPRMRRGVAEGAFPSS